MRGHSNQRMPWIDSAERTPPHPSATLTPSPQGEGLSLTKTHLNSLN
ncbi:MAG: hypothetical protein ACI4RP_03315 [Acutalibacteraceae bacterium]